MFLVNSLRESVKSLNCSRSLREASSVTVASVVVAVVLVSVATGVGAATATGAGAGVETTGAGGATATGAVAVEVLAADLVVFLEAVDTVAVELDIFIILSIISIFLSTFRFYIFLCIF